MVEIILLVLTALIAIPFFTLALESLAALLPYKSRPSPLSPRPGCAILIPAHNEEAGIETTIRILQKQTQPKDRICVIADNCTDATATRAKALGVEVFERTDTERRGKGFALAHGLSELQKNPPAIVVVLDADCRMEAGTLDRLVHDAVEFRQPIQGIYQIGTGSEPDPRQRLSAFAVLFKNHVRPLGLHQLGMPCLLTGTGMAFPWEALTKVELGTGNIVEDMKLGIDLAIAGYPPRLCPEARLEGDAAPNRKAAAKQRTRWEHGHVHTLRTQVPRLLLQGLIKRRPSLLGLAAEVGVPPLSLLIMLWAIIYVAAWGTVWIMPGEAGGLVLIRILLSIIPAVAILTMLMIWLKLGRKLLPIKILAFAPLYVLWKVPIYLRLMVRSEKTWVRTERTSLKP